MPIDELLTSLGRVGIDVHPCRILNAKPIESIETALGFRLPNEYVQLMQSVGGIEVGNLYLWDLKASLGSQSISFGNVSIACGPEYICSLFVKTNALVIGTNDNGTYFFIKGLRKNAERSGQCPVFRFEMDTIDEYEWELEDVKDLVQSSPFASESLTEFVSKHVA